MSENVEIKSGHDQDTAVLLLAAAEELELDVAVVRTTSDGFSVPREVADQAGVEYESDEDELSFGTKKEAEEYADSHGLDVDKSLHADDYKAAVVAAAKGE